MNDLDKGEDTLDDDSRELQRAAQKELDALGQQAEKDLSSLDHEALVAKYLELQRAYVSALNAVMLFKRQLAALRDHSLKSGQIADLSRKVNIADIDIISNVAIRDIPLFFQANYGALFLYDAETELLTLHNSWPRRIEQPALHLANDADTMLVHFLLNSREPLLIRNFEDYEKISGRELRPVAADKPLEQGGLLCPLVIGMHGRNHMLVGVLEIGQKDTGFTQHDADLATMMAEMVAAAISTSCLIDQMSHLAETDGLTQLYNHRHFQQELDRAIISSKRYGNPLSLAIIDIDHFKRFNDSHGHQAGDHVIKEVARYIRMAVREQIDIAARYGGEEFTVIMPNTDLDGARVASERIRQSIAAATVRLGKESYKVTVSVGVAQYSPEQSKSAFIDMADMALYKAKRQGRNQVMTAGQD